jgi:hypothetical protein
MISPAASRLGKSDPQVEHGANPQTARTIRQPQPKARLKDLLKLSISLPFCQEVNPYVFGNVLSLLSGRRIA